MNCCVVCNVEFVTRSRSNNLAKRSLSSRLRNKDVTTLEALQQLFNYQVLGLLLD